MHTGGLGGFHLPARSSDILVFSNLGYVLRLLEPRADPNRLNRCSWTRAELLPRTDLRQLAVVLPRRARRDRDYLSSRTQVEDLQLSVLAGGIRRDESRSTSDGDQFLVVVGDQRYIQRHHQAAQGRVVVEVQYVIPNQASNTMTRALTRQTTSSLPHWIPASPSPRSSSSSASCSPRARSAGGGIPFMATRLMGWGHPGRDCLNGDILVLLRGPGSSWSILKTGTVEVSGVYIVLVHILVASIYFSCGGLLSDNRRVYFFFERDASLNYLLLYHSP